MIFIDRNECGGRQLSARQPTVRMLLQPLVERNAIQYGLGKDENNNADL